MAEDFPEGAAQALPQLVAPLTLKSTLDERKQADEKKPLETEADQLRHQVFRKAGGAYQPAVVYKQAGACQTENQQRGKQYQAIHWLRGLAGVARALITAPIFSASCSLRSSGRFWT